MRASFIILLSGKDTPGIVKQVAQVVADHGGSWEEARMARLAGRFAGVVAVSVPETNVADLQKDLDELGGTGLTILVQPADLEPDQFETYRRLVFLLTGTDRDGIVREVTSVFVSHGVNVDEITTRRREAPMAGGRLFEITAELRCPPQTSLDDLRRGLEALSSELTVDITHRVDGDGAG